jgi:FlaA1/EpsC-like NDP-sugar epimerase
MMINKKILITGGTGSLGKALIKKIKKCFPTWKIIVFSRDEGKQAIYFADQPDITRIIGDVRDLEKLKTSMFIHKPDYVIHTAALKRVDDMEFHPDECVKTNIDGSRNVAVASLEAGVKKCMLISTDKACQPVNVYGSTKFIAERIFTNFDYSSESTIFASVRYGNVIASRGSFIPRWLDLISEDKKIKVTSLECTRFLFTLTDAVDTVLDSLTYAEGGEVFIPKINSFEMGTIIEAIKKINKVKEVEHEVIGLRPGEKIHEDMLSETELPFAKQLSDSLLCILPQYTNKEHTHDKVYLGKKFNSSLHVNKDIDFLFSLINRGLKDSE